MAKFAADEHTPSCGCPLFSCRIYVLWRRFVHVWKSLGEWRNVVIVYTDVADVAGVSFAFVPQLEIFELRDTTES